MQQFGVDTFLASLFFSAVPVLSSFSLTRSEACFEEKENVFIYSPN